MSLSTYYKLPIFDGLEALNANGYSTPFPHHFHPTFNISLVYEGNFETRLADKSLSATKGTILITNPQQIHANPCTKIATRSFFTFYLTPEFVEYASHQKKLWFNEHVIDDVFMFNALHQIAILIRHGNLNTSIEQELAVALERLALKYGTVSEGSDLFAAGNVFQNYLTQGYFEKFSLDEAAKEFGLDKYKFLRLFKFQTGLTPNNYLILKRIEQSKVMLADGAELLAVAIDLGFYDTAHFCRHFKKFTGTSPIAYQSSI